jgi:hypothetical protein
VTAFSAAAGEYLQASLLSLPNHGQTMILITSWHGLPAATAKWRPASIARLTARSRAGDFLPPMTGGCLAGREEGGTILEKPRLV